MWFGFIYMVCNILYDCASTDEKAFAFLQRNLLIRSTPPDAQSLQGSFLELDIIGHMTCCQKNQSVIFKNNRS